MIVAKVDATNVKVKELLGRLADEQDWPKVDSFPTLILHRPGASPKITEYDGRLKFEAVETFLRKLANGSLDQIDEGQNEHAAREAVEAAAAKEEEDIDEDFDL
jgi:hypothetical protein